MIYKTIVVGTDGTERSDVVVDHALSLAEANGGMVHVVHARRSIRDADSETDFRSAAVAESLVAYDSGDEICAQVVSEARRRGVVAEMHSAEGDPAAVIVDLAQRVSADLIVVGNRGMSGMKRFVLGSVPNKVSHNAPCSLLIVDTEHR